MDRAQSESALTPIKDALRSVRGGAGFRKQPRPSYEVLFYCCYFYHPISLGSESRLHLGCSLSYEFFSLPPLLSFVCARARARTNTHTHTYLHTHTYTHTHNSLSLYIYIYRERERERENWLKSLRIFDLRCQMFIFFIFDLLRRLGLSPSPCKMPCFLNENSNNNKYDKFFFFVKIYIFWKFW
jgi:hypothetical protein